MKIKTKEGIVTLRSTTKREIGDGMGMREDYIFEHKLGESERQYIHTLLWHGKQAIKKHKELADYMRKEISKIDDLEEREHQLDEVEDLENYIPDVSTLPELKKQFDWEIADYLKNK